VIGIGYSLLPPRDLRAKGHIRDDDFDVLGATRLSLGQYSGSAKLTFKRTPFSRRWQYASLLDNLKNRAKRTESLIPIPRISGQQKVQEASLRLGFFFV